MTASMNAATPIALLRTTHVCASPSIGMPIASNRQRMTVRRPLGVLKNRRVTRKPPRGVALERWRNEQAFNTLALEQSNAVLRTENERRRRQPVGHHRARRDDGG